MRRFGRISSAVAALLMAAIGPVLAQQPKSDGGATQPAPQQPQSGQPAADAPALPDPYKLNMLIRSSIIALNQANQTGNYTVLQDLAAPAFRASNDSARLAQIFAPLRQRNLDLTPILFFTPKLSPTPHFTPQGVLRLTGFFPTAPERVNFDLYFQSVKGEWRIFGIGVTTSPADLTAATEPQAPSAGERNGASGEKQANAAKSAVRGSPVPPPAKKPETPRQAAVQPQGGAVEEANAVQNRTNNNATRIDLSKASEQFVARDEPAKEETGVTESAPSAWSGFNPFDWR
jgi:hypothetical protein